jgi:hypothetical protein
VSPEAAVTITIGHENPALGALARDVRLAGVALGIEGVERLVEPLLGALPRVHRTPKLADRDRAFGAVV